MKTKTVKLVITAWVILLATLVFITTAKADPRVEMAGPVLHKEISELVDFPDQLKDYMNDREDVYVRFHVVNHDHIEVLELKGSSANVAGYVKKQLEGSAINRLSVDEDREFGINISFKLL